MAQRILDLRNLMGDEVEGIASYYEDATLELVRQARPSCVSSEARFAAAVTRLLGDRTSVPLALADAV